MFEIREKRGPGTAFEKMKAAVGWERTDCRCLDNPVQRDPTRYIVCREVSWALKVAAQDPFSRTPDSNFLELSLFNYSTKGLSNSGCMPTGGLRWLQEPTIPLLEAD